MITLQVKDKYELMAVHKLIYKSKFAENPPLRMAVFSPFIARFAHEVIDKIIEANAAEGNDEEAKGWAEMMELDEDIRELILTTHSSGEIREAARKKGLSSLSEDGWRIVAEGATTIDEVLRVTKDERMNGTGNGNRH